MRSQSKPISSRYSPWLHVADIMDNVTFPALQTLHARGMVNNHSVFMKLFVIINLASYSWVLIYFYDKSIPRDDSRRRQRPGHDSPATSRNRITQERLTDGWRARPSKFNKPLYSKLLSLVLKSCFLICLHSTFCHLLFASYMERMGFLSQIVDNK